MYEPTRKEEVVALSNLVYGYLSDPVNKVSANAIEAFSAAKAMLRQIIEGELIVCQEVPDLDEHGKKEKK